MDDAERRAHVQDAFALVLEQCARTDAPGTSRAEQLALVTVVLLAAQRHLETREELQQWVMGAMRLLHCWAQSTLDGVQATEEEEEETV